MRDLLVLVSRVNSQMSEVVLTLLAAGYRTGDVPAESVLDLAAALDPVAAGVVELVTALRARAADLGVVEITTPALGTGAEDDTNDNHER